MASTQVSPAWTPEDAIARLRSRSSSDLRYGVSLLLGDCVLIGLSFLVAVFVREWLARALGGFASMPLWVGSSWVGYLISGAVWIASLIYEGAYSLGLATVDRTDRVIKALSGGLAVSILLSYATHRADTISRIVLALAYVISLLMATLLRPVLARAVANFTRVRSQVDLWGGGTRVAMAARALEAAGFRICYQTGGLGKPQGNAAVVCLESTGASPLPLNQMEVVYREVGIVPPALWTNTFGAVPVNLRGLQIYVISHPLSRPINHRLKRAMDIVVAASLLLMLSPLLLILALAIRMTSPGPVLFGHRRLGCRGRTYRMWKFRTMMIDAEERLETLLCAHPELREEFLSTAKLKHDPRVTIMGKWLRRFSLDELPQLWNVLVGEMSLVGPRPIYLDSEVAMFGEAYPIMSSVRPGMTGVWQTSGRSDTSYSSRRDFDVYYVRRWSVWLDIDLLIRTLQAILLSEAY